MGEVGETTGDAGAAAAATGGVAASITFLTLGTALLFLVAAEGAVFLVFFKAATAFFLGVAFFLGEEGAFFALAVLIEVILAVVVVVFSLGVPFFLAEEGAAFGAFLVPTTAVVFAGLVVSDFFKAGLLAFLDILK